MNERMPEWLFTALIIAFGTICYWVGHIDGTHDELLAMSRKSVGVVIGDMRHEAALARDDVGYYNPERYSQDAVP